MADFQILWVTMTPPANHHRHIEYLGGEGHKRWKISRAGMVTRIKKGEERYYAVDPRNGKSAWLRVVEPSDGPPYVQTYADGDWGDNLLALPRPCPSDCEDLG